MEPVSAVIISLAVAWAITRGAADAAVSQAAQEARAAADAVRGDLRGRSEAWARRLGDRIADGRSGGPATGLWWAWAATRTGRAVRNALRREPRHGERARAIRGTTGPWRRIFDAGVAGARFARAETRRQREARQRPTRVQTAVCEWCGAVVAAQSLEEATVGPAQRRLRVCVACRATKPESPGPANRQAADRAGEGTVVDAEVVDTPPAPAGEQPALNKPRPELDAPGGGPARPAGEPVKPTPKPPAPTGSDTPAVPGPAPERAATAVDQPQIKQGEPMAPRAPGQLVPRHGNRVATHAARGNGGESYTHGQWNRAVADIEKRLDALPVALEMMLHRLNTADAGRSQVVGVVALHDQIALFMKQVREMLAEVNRLEQPVLNAVENAGGPDEIASISYLREV